MGGERESLGLVWIDCSYPVVAAGLKEALGGRARVHVGHTAPADAEVPCCAVFDTSGAESISEGIERKREVDPDISILVFSLHVDPPLARAALRHGARGFIHAGMQLNQIARAVEVAHEGEIVAPRKLLEYLIANEDPADIDALTIHPPAGDTVTRRPGTQQRTDRQEPLPLRVDGKATPARHLQGPRRERP